jgi:hypothetical protein
MRNVEKFVELGIWCHVNDCLKRRLTRRVRMSIYDNLHPSAKNVIWNDLRLAVSKTVAYPTTAKIEDKIYKYKF